MDEQTITLIEPTVEFKTEFLAMAEDYFLSGDNRYKSDSDDFSGYLVQIESNRSENLPPERVRQSEYWLILEHRIIGCTRLRYWLNSSLEYEGGHIGYDIRPSERGRGYGSLILKLTLEKAKNAGLTRALLTCDEDNIASVKVIEANGGVLHERAISKHSNKPIRRYWIELKLSKT